MYIYITRLLCEAAATLIFTSTCSTQGPYMVFPWHVHSRCSWSKNGTNIIRTLFEKMKHVFGDAVLARVECRMRSKTSIFWNSFLAWCLMMFICLFNLNIFKNGPGFLNFINPVHFSTFWEIWAFYRSKLYTKNEEHQKI